MLTSTNVVERKGLTIIIQCSYRQRFQSSPNPSLTLPIAYHVPAHEVSDVNHHVYLGCPHFKLSLPRGESGQGHHQQERAIELVLMKEVRQE